MITEKERHRKVFWLAAKIQLQWCLFSCNIDSLAIRKVKSKQTILLVKERAILFISCHVNPLLDYPSMDQPQFGQSSHTALVKCLIPVDTMCKNSKPDQTRPGTAKYSKVQLSTVWYSQVQPGKQTTAWWAN